MTTVDTPAAFTPAPAATRAGRVAWWGIVLAVLTVALGVLVLREALVAADALGGTPWLAPAVDSVDGLGPSTALMVAGALVALLGVWLVAVAFGRRVRTRLPVTSSAGTTIGVNDLARLAAAAADDVDAVLSARASATRKSVTVTVTTLEGDDVAEAVRTAVHDRLEPLVHAPAVRVVTRVTAGLHAAGDAR